MRVHQNDVRQGLLGEEFSQYQRHSAGLAGPGRTENRKMLAQHFVDLDNRRDGRVLVDPADLDGIETTEIVGLFKHLVCRCKHLVAKPGIDRDPAAECAQIAIILARQFAHQFHIHHPVTSQAGVALRTGNFHRCDQAEDDCSAGINSHDRAHVGLGDVLTCCALARYGHEDPRHRAGDGDNFTDCGLLHLGPDLRFGCCGRCCGGCSCCWFRGCSQDIAPYVNRRCASLSPP